MIIISTFIHRIRWYYQLWSRQTTKHINTADTSNGRGKHTTTVCYWSHHGRLISRELSIAQLNRSPTVTTGVVFTMRPGHINWSVQAVWVIHSGAFFCQNNMSQGIINPWLLSISFHFDPVLDTLDILRNTGQCFTSETMLINRPNHTAYLLIELHMLSEFTDFIQLSDFSFSEWLQLGRRRSLIDAAPYITTRY